MAHPDYTAAQADAAAAIREYGGDIEVLVSGGSDPVTGGTLPDMVVASGRALVLKYKSYQIDGTVIKQGDKVLMAESTVELTKNQKVRVGGLVYTIINVDELALDGSTRIFSKAQVRR